MALTNAYCTLSDLKDSLSIEDIQDDVALEAAIMAASRMIDDYTGRFFYKDGTTISPVTRYYTAQDWWTTNTDDFISISQIATDDNIKYKISFEKICRMYKNAIENGFATVSYTHLTLPTTSRV